MNHRSLRFISLMLVILAATWSFAQVDLGTITGTVTDPGGAVVPDAKVTVTNNNTAAVRSTTSDANGFYTIAGLRPDSYTVKVEAQGFAAFAQKVQLTVGSKAEVSAKLRVAASTTTVEVVGSGGVSVETQSQEVAQAVDEKQIRDLPTLDRNPYDLVATAGNVARDPNEGATSRGVGFSVNGQRESATNVQLDGTENADLFGGSVGQTIPLDAMQEFKVVTSGLSAEYGRTTGGVVNVATKSGSNDFHGSVYEWNRVSAMAAEDYDSNSRGLEKGHFTRNQFGYSIGGPVKKNKLFFFNTTEWLRIRSSANDVSWVPMPSFIGAAGTCPATTLQGGCSPDGINTQNLFSANSLKSGVTAGPTLTTAQMITALGGKYRPCLPTQTPGVGPCFTNGTRLTANALNNPLFFGTSNPDGSSNVGLPLNLGIFQQVSQTLPVDAGAGTPQNTYRTLSRVDYNISDKTTITGRYALESILQFDGSNSNSPWKNYDTGFTAFTQNFQFGLTRVFTPTMVSNSKINFERYNQDQPLSAAGVAPSVYFNGAGAFAVSGVNVALPGYLPYSPGSAIPFGGPQNYAQFAEDLSWTKGKHTWKFGGMFLYVKDNHHFGAYQNAVEAFSPSGVGSGLDGFLNGHLASFQVAVDGQGKFPCSKNPSTDKLVPTADCSLSLPVASPSFSRSNRFRDGAAYVNDSWKLTSRFTVNAGLRWEYYGVQHNNNGDLDSNFYFGSGNTIFERIANGSVKTAPTSELGGLWAPKKKNFAPRLGFAWDVFGDGKTSIRGGFGMGYERNFGNVTFNVIQNPPAQINVTFTSPADGTILVAANNLGQFATGTGTKAIPNASLRAVDPNIQTARSDFWNLSIEREIAKNTTFGVTYSGSKGTNLYSIANINRPGSGTVYLQRTDSNGLTPGECKPDPADATKQICYALTAQRMNLQYSNINFRGSDGASEYHGLTTSLRTNNLMNSGLNLTFNWTWSHAMDDLSSTFTDGGANVNNLGFLDPFNPKLDWGSADFDIRHRITMSAMWAIPFAKNTKGFVNRVFDGWEIAPVITARTGAPFSVFDCNNAAFLVCPRATFDGAAPAYHDPTPTGEANTFSILDLSNAVGGSYLEPTTGTSEFPTCTGALYQGCTWPANMSRRNSFRGPGTYNVDLGILKNIKITERQKLQFRAEMFNALNHPVLFPVLSGNNDVAVGDKILANYGGNGYQRRIQFALKYTF